MRFDVAVVTHVGIAPPGYNHSWVTHTVHYHGFSDLSTERGARFDSPEFMLLGNQWRLKIYPGGEAATAEGMTPLYLCNKSDKSIEIDFGVSVNDENGKQVEYERSEGPEHFAPLGDAAGDDWGFELAKRSTLLSSLVDGTLVIEVRMRLTTPTKSVPPPFIPENPVAQMIQGVFMDEKYSDIVFEVVGEEEPKILQRKSPWQQLPSQLIVSS